MRTATVVVANVTGWPIIQLLIAWGATKMSPQRFANDSWIYQVGNWEARFYRRWLRIRRWKHLLPDGARWMGGTFSRKLESRTPPHLCRFSIETRRSEIAHWLMLACAPIFFLWNPPWARIVMVLYAAAANLPCIVVQRYNRRIVERLLLR
jgi:glycosyl-4,4'-diaponeurosporenoate acyltransferase